LERRWEASKLFLKDVETANKWIADNIPIPEGRASLSKDVKRILKNQQEKKMSASLSGLNGFVNKTLYD